MDPYVNSSAHVLRNKASLRDATVLAAHESRMVLKRMLELYAEPCPGTLNVAHLSAIHHALFQDLYSWAGQFRTGNMSICGKTFCQAAMLETSLDLCSISSLRSNNSQGSRQTSSRAEHHPSFPGWQGRNAARIHLSTRAAGRSQGTVGTNFEMVNASKLSFSTNRPDALVYVMRKAIGLSH